MGDRKKKGEYLTFCGVVSQDLARPVDEKRPVRHSRSLKLVLEWCERLRTVRTVFPRT